MAPVKIAMPPSRSGDERFSLCAISRFDVYYNNPDPKKNSILKIATFVNRKLSCPARCPLFFGLYYGTTLALLSAVNLALLREISSSLAKSIFSLLRYQVPRALQKEDLVLGKKNHRA
jgi:hypothetical protein